MFSFIIQITDQNLSHIARTQWTRDSGNGAIWYEQQQQQQHSEHDQLGAHWRESHSEN